MQRAVIWALASIWFVPVLGLAQDSLSGLISPAVATRYGLVRSWQTRVEVDSSRGRIAYTTLHVSPTRAVSVHEINYDGRTITITEKDLDTFGQTLGKDGSKKLAQETVRKLREKDQKPTLVSREVPETTLYVQSTSGTLHALDAETGRTRWVITVGHPDRLTLAPAANDDFVAVVNGSQLYILDRATGSMQWDQKLGSAPGAGPCLSEKRVFVPMINGTLEAYDVRGKRGDMWRYGGAGHAMVQPMLNSQTVSWPTDRGHLIIAKANEKGVRFRLEAHDTIVSHSAYLAPSRIFATSYDGYLHAMNEAKGNILWKFSTGEPVSEPPVAIGTSAYVITDSGGMFRVDAETGQEIWWTPQVRKFLSASKDRVYCLSQAGRVLIIDLETGGRIDTLPVQGIDLAVTNWQTDRIYLGTTSGVLQCLHQVENVWPIPHALEEVDAAAKPATPAAGGQPAAPAGPMNIDPFAKPVDPFAPAADPFGPPKPAADPFGAPAAAPDPFGAAPKAADPFGAAP